MSLPHPVLEDPSITLPPVEIEGITVRFNPALSIFEFTDPEGVRIKISAECCGAGLFTVSPTPEMYAKAVEYYRRLQ